MLPRSLGATIRLSGPTHFRLLPSVAGAMSLQAGPVVPGECCSLAASPRCFSSTSGLMTQSGTSATLPSPANDSSSASASASLSRGSAMLDAFGADDYAFESGASSSAADASLDVPPQLDAPVPRRPQKRKAASQAERSAAGSSSTTAERSGGGPTPRAQRKGAPATTAGSPSGAGAPGNKGAAAAGGGRGKGKGTQAPDTSRSTAGAASAAKARGAGTAGGRGSGGSAGSGGTTGGAAGAVRGRAGRGGRAGGGGSQRFVRRTWRSVGGKPDPRGAKKAGDAAGAEAGADAGSAIEPPAAAAGRPRLPMLEAYHRSQRALSAVRSLPAFDAAMTSASAAAIESAQRSALAAAAAVAAAAAAPAAAGAAVAAAGGHAAAAGVGKASSASSNPSAPAASPTLSFSPGAAETAIFSDHLAAPLELLLSLLAAEGASSSLPNAAQIAVLQRATKALQEALAARRVIVGPLQPRSAKKAAKAAERAARAAAAAADSSADAAASGSALSADDEALASGSNSGGSSSGSSSAEAAAAPAVSPDAVAAGAASGAAAGGAGAGAAAAPAPARRPRPFTPGLRSRPLHPSELIAVLRVLASARMADTRTLGLLCSAILEGMHGAAGGGAAPAGSAPLAGVGFAGVVPEALRPDDAAVALSSLASLAGGSRSSVSSGENGSDIGSGSGGSTALPRAAEELAAALLPLLSTRMGSMHARDLCFLARALGTAAGRGAAVAPALLAHVGAQIAARVRSPKDDALPRAGELGIALSALSAAGVRSHKAVQMNIAASMIGSPSSSTGSSGSAGGADASPPEEDAADVADAATQAGIAGSSSSIASSSAATATSTAAGTSRGGAASRGALTLPTRAADVALAHAIIRILPAADARGVVAIARAASRFGLVGADASVRSPGRSFSGVAAAAGEDLVWAALENRLAELMPSMRSKQLAGIAASFARASRWRALEIRLAMGTAVSASTAGFAPGAGPTAEPAVGSMLLWRALRSALLPHFGNLGRPDAARVAWAFATVGQADEELLSAVSLRMLGQAQRPEAEGQDSDAPATASAAAGQADADGDEEDNEDDGDDNGKADSTDASAGGDAVAGATAAASAAGAEASASAATATESTATAPVVGPLAESADAAAAMSMSMSMSLKQRKALARGARREQRRSAARIGPLHQLHAARAAAADGALLMTALAAQYPFGNPPQPHADALAVQLLRVAAALAEAVEGSGTENSKANDSQAEVELDIPSLLAATSVESQAALASVWVATAGPVTAFLLHAMTAAGALPRNVPSHVWKSLSAAAQSAAASASAAAADGSADAPAAADADAAAAARAALAAALPQLHSSSLAVPLSDALLASATALQHQPDAALRRLPLATLTEMLTVYAVAVARWGDFASATAAASASGEAPASSAAGEPLSAADAADAATSNSSSDGTASDAGAQADASGASEHQVLMYESAQRVLAALQARGLANDTLAALLRRHHPGVRWSPHLTRTVLGCGFPRHAVSPAQAAAQAAQSARSAGAAAFGSVLRARSALQ